VNCTVYRFLLLFIVSVQGMDKIIETLDSIGMKLLAALKEHQYLSLFFCVCAPCSASFSARQIVFSNSSYGSTAKWDICQIFGEDSLLVRV
jgi:hypothetical protein